MARVSGSAGWEPPPETRSETESHAQRRRAAPKGNSGRQTPRGPKQESWDPEAERPEGQVPGGASHSEAMRGRGGQKPEDRPRGPTSSEGRREARPQTSRSDIPCGQHEGDRRPRERGRHREDTRTTLPPPPPLTENTAGRAGGGRGPHGGARRHGGAVRGRGRGRGEFSSPSACGSDRAQHTRVTRARGDPGSLGAVSPGRFTRALWESELALARRKRARTQTDKSEARAGREVALRFSYAVRVAAALR